MAMIDAKDLDREIQFEQKVRPAGKGKAGQETWQPVGGIAWAQVRDALPSRSENTEDGLPIATRRARVRLRYRDDITPDMRILYGARTMQIIAGPVELGRREGLELMAEDYSTAGTGA
jgi:head-tail adaptor